MRALIDGDVILHSCLWGTKNFEEAKGKIEFSLESWSDGAFCSERIVALGPEEGKNYRDDIYHLYKQTATRVKGRGVRLEHFYQTKEYLYSLPDALVADNEEADDLLGILLYDDPENSVVITSDKDLDQLPGLHYNPGILTKDKKPIFYEQKEEDANRFFLKQMLMGDGVDKIPGIPGLGVETADKLIADIKPYQAVAELVIEEYKKRLKDDWYNWFLANGKLLYLRRRCYENFTMDLYQKRFLQ